MLNRQSLTSETLTFEDLTTIVGAYNVDANGDPVSGAEVHFDNRVEPNGDNRGFMMTTMETNGYEERYLAEKEDDEYETITLSVGRAMAKVSLGTELPNYIDDEKTPNGTLDVESYKIINNPEQMYVMPNITNNVLITPYYFNSQTTDGNYFASHNSSHSDHYITVSKDDAQTFAYCIENANLTPRQGNATIAVVKGVFTPAGNASVVESPEGDSANLQTATLSKGETFYRIWVPQYTNEATGELAGNRYDGYYYKEDPRQGSVLQDYFDAIQTSMGFPNDLQLIVEEFTNGVCYYRLPLYNKDHSMAPYTVKRNSYYKIDIVSVTDAGYPGEDGGDGNEIKPEEPLEAQTHIEVKITVDAWDEIEQDGAL